MTTTPTGVPASLDVAALQALPETAPFLPEHDELGLAKCWITCEDTCYVTCFFTG
jgi:hypothetical protein